MAYERFEGEVVANEDEIVSSASEDAQSIDRMQQQLLFHGDSNDPHSQRDGNEVVDSSDRLRRVHELLQNKWPYKIGTLHILWGVVLLLLAIAQLVIIPLFDDKDESSNYWKPDLTRTNCYGVTLWASLLMLLSGTLGVRAAIYKNTCDLYSFVTVIMLEVVVFSGFTILIVIAFSSHWITSEAFPSGSINFPVSITSAVCVVFGFILTVLAYIQYYEDVFCGELQLCRRCVHCCLPCLCPRAVSQQELLEEDISERPPSLPV